MNMNFINVGFFLHIHVFHINSCINIGLVFNDDLTMMYECQTHG